MNEKQFREKERTESIKKKTHRRKRKKRAGAAAFLLVLLALLIISAATFSAYYYFKIENITVEGNTLYTSEDIIEKSEIKTGDSLLFISENKVAEKLKKDLPYISGVKFERQLPKGLKLLVSETYEVLCFYKDGCFVSADTDFKLLNAYSERPEALPVIVAGEDEKLETGVRYACSNDSRKTIQDSVLKFSKDKNISVTVINAKDPYRAYFVIEDRIAIELGSMTYLDRKLEFVPKAIENMKEREHCILDLSNWAPENNEAISYEKDINRYMVFN